MITNKQLGLTNNQLKIIALISMIIDHVGVAFFPDEDILRIIGRLAFPIYAYLIAEGCKHTKNRKKHLGLIAGMAFVFQIFYFVFMNDLYMGILVTFSLSIAFIFTIESFIKNNSPVNRAFMSIIFIGLCYFGIACPELYADKGFYIDYGVWGIFLPVLIYFAPNKLTKICVTTLTIVAMAIFAKPLQWWALLAVPLLALYNGKRGKARIKYLFYIVYPLHLVVIYIIMFLIRFIK